MKRLFLLSALSLLFSSTFTARAIAGELTEVRAGDLWSQAVAAYQHGNYPEAIKLLSARSRMEPKDPNVYYYLGNCYLQTKQTDDAAHMFSACVRMAPGTQAGQYSLQALERLSTMPKTAEPKPVDNTPDAAQIEASKDALVSERALDKDFNQAVKRIQNERSTLKRRIDHIFEKLQEDLASMNRRNTPNFAAEILRLKGEAEMEVERLQTKEMRFENRLMAPDKIDVRAVPELPKQKDDTKTALGSLAEYFKPEQPFDPLGADITPELAAKFMTIKDAFGDLSTYQPQARELAKQMFRQMKNSVEMKEDSFDNAVHQEKDRLLRDLYSIQTNYGNQAIYKNLNPLQALASTSIPRSNQDNLTPMDQELSQVTERAKKRLKELQDSYNRDIDSMIAGTKERLASLVGQTITMGSSLKHPKGTVQLIPQGTTLHTKNYINFGDRDK